jgi:hypothetical protein
MVAKEHLTSMTQDAVETIGIHAYKGRPWPLDRPTATEDKNVYIWRPAGALPKGLAVDRIIVSR